jgi:hypothetical protein
MCVTPPSTAVVQCAASASKRGKQDARRTTGRMAALLLSHFPFSFPYYIFVSNSDNGAKKSKLANRWLKTNNSAIR